MIETDELIMEQLEMNGDELTPISIFLNIEGERKCLLESSTNVGHARYSIIGVNPVELLRAEGNHVTRQNLRTEEISTQTGNPVQLLQQAVTRPIANTEFPFLSGAIGYVGYDTIRSYENIGAVPDSDRHLPDALLAVYDEVILYDHLEHRVHLIHTSIGGLTDRTEMRRRLQARKNQLERTGEQTRIERPLENIVYQPQLEKETFLSLVDQAKEHIRKGDVFQLVLSQRLDATFAGDPFHFYRKLRQDNPSPYLFYIDLGEVIVLGASPESLIQVKGRRVTTNPIAGTRPRGKTKRDDERLAEELAQDEKEQAEHKMLVDLGRNDLGQVCQVGTVRVSRQMEIERFKNVMHLVSVVEGTLTEGKTGADALIACLPAGTVSGAPKIRAMQLINQYETKKREVYAGAVGYFDVSGNLDFALAIRTMVIQNGKAYVQAGAGIVYDSDPTLEYEETLHKAKSLLEVWK
ncbi:anthranilate synthase component I [Exiguobacterium antarcticum]|uniref:Anthranilate synthase component 1 n=1 Tax=Exiguobacterium antarcticum TaxID=132920 RepID=A0ABT6R2Z7_9BACL|nr:anthranilate synthase component I [Exiguobacterium antarcticum]MDI3235329.1 anthranilate synthase component I [Exiguobacterium antarcticum]